MRLETPAPGGSEFSEIRFVHQRPVFYLKPMIYFPMEKLLPVALCPEGGCWCE
jgi:hypothetical protein